jgi:uncharacterized protein YkwD
LISNWINYGWNYSYTVPVNGVLCQKKGLLPMLSSPKKHRFLHVFLIACFFAAATIWSVEPTPVHASGQSIIPSPETLMGCGGSQFPSSDEAFEQEVLRLVNQIRLDNRLLPLKRVETLTSAARFHATDMSEEDYFSHTSHDRVNGELAESCEWGDRISTYYTDWNLIAENIAAGHATPQGAVDGWMNSTGHKHNILSPYLLKK